MHAMISTKLFPGCHEGSDAAEGDAEKKAKWRAEVEKGQEAAVRKSQ